MGHLFSPPEMWAWRMGRRPSKKGPFQHGGAGSDSSAQACFLVSLPHKLHGSESGKSRSP